MRVGFTIIGKSNFVIAIQNSIAKHAEDFPNSHHAEVTGLGGTQSTHARSAKYLYPAIECGHNSFGETARF